MQKTVKLIPNKDLDFFLMVNGKDDIPTKQDKFKPLINSEIVHVTEDGTHIKLDEYELYLKKKGKDNLIKFEERFKKELLKKINKPPLFKNNLLEVIISLHMSKSRFNSVDLDNILKSVFDCMNGIVYTDDSQISSIIASKKLNEIPNHNGLYIGIRLLSEEKPSYFESFRFGHFEDVNEC